MTAASGLTRRRFLEATLSGGAALTAWSLLGRPAAPDAWAATNGGAARVLSLNRDWRFGGRFVAGSTAHGFDDSRFARVNVPHTVVDLSWRNWEPSEWEDVFIYRRHFDVPPSLLRHRLFVDFDAVIAVATPHVNGAELADHRGGYLPFSREITDHVEQQDNVLAVVADSRWLQVPPAGDPEGASSIDWLQPGGIVRSVSLRAVPQVFVADVFARPVDVLERDRRVHVTCTIDAAVVPERPVRLDAALRDGSRVVARDSRTIEITSAGETKVELTLDGLGDVALWDVDDPHLHHLETRLSIDGQPVHEHRARIGLRDARFELDGFFLNGRRLQLFGLNHHELYPYAGFAMPARVQRRDAEILKRELNCNMVRCSHYPQSSAFMDACDELGLLVWEEMPGWHYIGDEAWQDLAVRDVEQMVARDRNRPSVVIWGVRINESLDDTTFYSRTRQAAKTLDGSRPTAGATNGARYFSEDYLQDVFGFNDYSGTETLRPPRRDRPYLVTEAVGQWPRFRQFYRRIDPNDVQQQQAFYHAQVHNHAGSDAGYCGLIAWVSFDYTSTKPNTFERLKWSGVADFFRVPKPGAAIYQAQADPGVRPVIQPAFYWHFGDAMPDGPGDDALVASNCERLEVFVGDRHHATVAPDRTRFPHLAYPPFFVDFGGVPAEERPELRIDGYVGERLLLSRRFSADPSADELSLVADDDELAGDGSDATRVVFRAVDRYGAPRPYVPGTVTLELEGPAALVGDNPFPFADHGGVGAVWVRAADGGVGSVRVTAAHPELGSASVAIRVRRSPAVLEAVDGEREEAA